VYPLDNPNVPLTAPPPISDPSPGGGWTYEVNQGFLNGDFSYPFYYDALEDLTQMCALFVSGSCLHDVVEGNVLNFFDAPADFDLAASNAQHNSSQFMAFTTSLVGVLPGNIQGPALFSWTWQSNFDGTNGGVTTTKSRSPVDPGSGTGRVTVTSVNGVPVGPCDLQYNGSVTVADVQLIINEALGVTSAVNDLNGDGVVNVADVQIEINAALGLGCAAN
jgi:hypothetical protein